MPPEVGATAIFESCGSLSAAAGAITKSKNTQKEQQRVSDRRSAARDGEHEILVDDKGRPYDLGPEGFVRDLNTRAIRIARRIEKQSFQAMADATAADAAARACGASPPNSCSTERTCLIHARAAGDTDNSSAVPAGGGKDGNISGTVRKAIAQEIQFVLGGRLPFVKRSELLVWSWVCTSGYGILRFGLLTAGFAHTLAAFVVMYVVLDFYSGVLHVVLDDEWNMNVPLLSQPAMEFQYHHHIPDDGCSRPFVEGMGDLNFIVALHLALFIAIFVRGGCEDALLLCAGSWKMLLAYWGIWNHRQVR